MDITELRNQINEIDEQLVGLFCKRLDTAKKIGEYKKENSLPVLDEGREQAVLDKVSALADDGKEEYVRELYQKIFEISRNCQQELISGEEDK